MTAEGARKIAIVTGGAGGIGRATALMLARDGADVVVADIDEQGGRETVARIEQLGHGALFVRTDVSNEAHCATLIQRTLDHFGQLDVAFNNAGIIGSAKLTAEYGTADWQRVIDINLSGVFHCMRHELAAMRTGGAIVNTASVMGLQGVVGGSAYCAAKHGVIGLTKAAALEYGKRGIRINAICPGFIATDMTLGAGSIMSDAKIQAGVAQTALRRIGEAEEVASVVAWLCSDRASFVTGAIHTIDGGFSAG